MTGRAPTVPLALAFVAGLILPGVAPELTFFLAALFLAGAFLCARRERLVAGSALALCAFAALAGAARERKDDALSALYASLGEESFVSPSRLTGRLRSEPLLGSESAVLLLELEEMRVGRRLFAIEGGVRVTVRGEERDTLRALARGDRVTLWAGLRRPPGLRNPGGFDVARHLERRRVALVGSVKSALLVERLESAGPLQGLFSRLRRRALDALERKLQGRGVTLGVVAALVTGDRSRLDPELERRFQRAGVFHVMAISGAHVAILALLVAAALRRAGIDEAPALGGLLVLLPLYAGFCGGRPPVVRAVVMAEVVLAARLLSLDRPRFNALGLGAIGLLVWDPAWLEDPGFQLSFAAMASILWLFDPASFALGRLGWLASPLAVSLSAQAGVVPVTAWHFLRLTPLAPLSSLLAIPLAGGVVAVGLALVVVSGAPGLDLFASLLALVAEALVALLAASAELFARAPFASLDTGRPAPWWVLGYAAALLALRASSRRGRRAALAALLGLVLALLPGTPPPPDELSLTALDVGHGDALVLRLPGGESLLVDGGGAPGSSFDVGAAVVLPYLRASGVRSLDAVVVSHPDFDHMGGLLTVVEEMRVGEIWEGLPRRDRAAYRALRDRAERRGVGFRRLVPGERFELGGVGFEVLAAGGLEGLEGALEDNDASVVLRLDFGGARILLTGDAERALEEALLREPARLRADVLKVAHHGSRSSTSPEFLEAVSPSIAVVSGRRSAGRPLPSEEVLERLRRRGVRTLRTDERGAITVRVSASGEIRVSTFLLER